MIKHYLRITFQSFKKDFSYSIVNLLGLSLAIYVCAFCGLYVYLELSYDRQSISYPNIYRVNLDVQLPNKNLEFAVTTPPMGPAFKENFEEVVEAFRVAADNNVVVRYSGNDFYENRFYYAEPSIFEFLPVHLTSGDKNTALIKPFSVLISENIAKKYFGDTDPVNKSITINDSEYIVVGVYKEFPLQSHFKPDFLASFSTFINANKDRIYNWGWTSVYTYLLLEESSEVKGFQNKINAFLKNRITDEWIDNWSLGLQPLTEIHLYSDRIGELEKGGDIKYVYFVIICGISIFLITTINHVTLSIARSVRRAKEIGLKKVFGSSRSKVVIQILIESLFISVLAIILGGVLFELIFKGSIISEQFNFGSQIRPIVFLFVFMVGILIPLLAGAYPALLISGLKPIRALQGRYRFTSSGKKLRITLILLQFSATIILLISLMTISRQLKLVLSRDLGYNKENMIIIPINSEGGQENYETIKGELLGNSSISNVTASSGHPGKHGNSMGFLPEGFPQNSTISIPIIFIDQNFIETYNIELTKGTNIKNNLTDEFLINESGAKEFGWQNPINKSISWPNGEISGRIVGVIKDFYFEPLHNKLGPILLKADPTWFNQLSVKTAESKLPETLDFLRKKWADWDSGYPLQYSILQESIRNSYSQETRLENLIKFSTAINLVITCVGFLGFIAFITEQRRTELTLRKVFGATSFEIGKLLVKNLAQFIIISTFIAIPLAHLLLKPWLLEFAYRIDLGIEIYFASFAVVFIIAIIVMSFEVIRSSIENPIKNLHQE